MLDRLRAVIDSRDPLEPSERRDPDETPDTSIPEDAADTWAAFEGLTDAGTPTEFSHELYVDATNLAAALADCSPASVDSRDADRSPGFDRSLEVGCGYGRLTPWIADHAADHHAVDYDRHLLAAAAAEYPEVKFHRARAEELPFPDDTFDLAVTWGVLNHVPSARIEAAAAELDRVVASDGTLVVSEATDGTPDPRWEYRSVEEWRDLFAPRHLVARRDTERDEERFRDPDREHVVMTFE